uniref:Uncharacterized protein n=1 Tax=viral metagenome TaxID=1070528 RepID=A0A6H1ZHY9_9ZZZZ
MTNKHAQNWTDLATFTYDQLSDRGKANAINKYLLDNEVTELMAQDNTRTPAQAFYLLDWTFNAHGERIA